MLDVPSRQIEASQEEVAGKQDLVDAGRVAGDAVVDTEELDSWFLDGIDLLLQHLPDQGERAAEAIRDQLSEIDS